MENTLHVEQRGAVCVLTLFRPEKRNAINDELLGALELFFQAIPESARVVVLQGSGEHFCSGLDLAERLAKSSQNPIDGVRHSRRWHRVFEMIQYGEIPVVSVLKGAVIGGGMELAVSTHVRVAERQTFFRLPEGQHGIFVGGGGSVRIPRIIGAGRMMEMMLTGRQYDAGEGVQMGLVHHLVKPGQGLAHALELAERIASNAFLSNYAIINAIPRAMDMSTSDGLFAESMVGALTRAGADGRERIQRYFETRKKTPEKK